MKLPVFTAFGAAIAYVTSHFLTLLRIVWLPALLLTGVTFYLMPAAIEAQMSIAMTEPGAPPDAAVFAAIAESFKWTGVIYLASAIFYPMLIAGVLKHLLRGAAPRLPFYLQFGADEVFVLIAYILLMVMLMIAGFAGFLAVMVVGVIGAVLSEAAGGLVVLLLMIAFVVAMIWFSLRLSLIFPASVSERTVGVVQSWNATKGAAWSLFFYWFLWMMVLAFLGGAYAVFSAGDMFSYIPEMIAAGGDEAAIAEIEQRMLEAQMGMFDRSRPGFWVHAGATYIYMMLNMVLWSAAAGVAWRYLAGEERA
ncbi:hypothetical protein [Hyphococcus sp.]|uniref:hypothetical protein n=1 Tax=Hyphococcus sp. TaxID=2038636 RepID=UPI0035C66C41